MKASELLKALGEELNEVPNRAILPPEELRALAKFYLIKHSFEPGDLVQWKPKMKNRTLPAYGEAMAVIAYKDEQTDPVENAGSPCFREPTDIRLATTNDEGDMMCFWFDSSRFEPYSGK